MNSAFGYDHRLHMKALGLIDQGRIEAALDALFAVQARPQQPSLQLASVKFRISRCKKSPRVPYPGRYLKQSWDLCRSTISDTDDEEDCTLRRVLETNILHALLADQIDATHEDPTMPDYMEAPFPDAVTLARVANHIDIPRDDLVDAYDVFTEKLKEERTAQAAKSVGLRASSAPEAARRTPLKSARDNENESILSKSMKSLKIDVNEINSAKQLLVKLPQVNGDGGDDYADTCAVASNSDSGDDVTDNWAVASGSDDSYHTVRWRPSRLSLP